MLLHRWMKGEMLLEFDLLEKPDILFICCSQCNDCSCKTLVYVV
jgi:hypothetical protein